MNLQNLFKIIKLPKGHESDEARKIRELAARADQINGSSHVRRL